MSNNFTHTVVGSLSGLAIALHDKEKAIDPVSAICTSALFAKLPDILEPSLNNPHHRQFFHSVIVLSTIGLGVKKIYEWKPKDNRSKFWRALALCAGVGYISHLLLDGVTPRSLPLIGKM